MRHPFAHHAVRQIAFSEGAWRKIITAMDRADAADDVRCAAPPARQVHADAGNPLLAGIFSKDAAKCFVERPNRADTSRRVAREPGTALEIGGAQFGTIADAADPGAAGVIPALRMPMNCDGERRLGAPTPASGERDGPALPRLRDGLDGACGCARIHPVLGRVSGGATTAPAHGFDRCRDGGGARL